MPNQKSVQKVLIIGAGPAGISLGIALKREGIAFLILEKSDKVFSSWHNHYDRLHLHTVKKYSEFIDYPIPKNWPTFISKTQFIEYGKLAVANHNLPIEYSTEICAIKQSGALVEVLTKNREVFTAQAVVICTGINALPKHPRLNALSAYSGQEIHSRDYKNPEQLKGSSALVVGFGNSGAEIALDLALSGKRVGIVVRSSKNIVPLRAFGRPTQLSAVAASKLPSFLGDKLGYFVRWFYYRDISKYGLQFPIEPPAKQIREQGKTPVIDLGTIELIRKQKITVHPAIKKANSNIVEFVNGEKEEYQSVVIATGYKPHFPEMHYNQMPLKFEQKKGETIISPAGIKDLRIFTLGFSTRYSGILNGIQNNTPKLVSALSKIISSCSILLAFQ